MVNLLKRLLHDLQVVPLIVCGQVALLACLPQLLPVLRFWIIDGLYFTLDLVLLLGRIVALLTESGTPLFSHCLGTCCDVFIFWVTVILSDVATASLLLLDALLCSQCMSEAVLGIAASLLFCHMGCDLGC